MAYNFGLMAVYAQDARVMWRNYAGWLVWSRDQLAQPVPANWEVPPLGWVKLRLLAERVPAMAESLAQRTRGYFLQHPAILERLGDAVALELMPEQEEALAAAILAALADIAPRVAAQEISTPEAQAWRPS